MKERLLLARVSVAGDKGVTETALKKDLLPIFTRALGSSADAKAVIAELMDQQVAMHNLVRKSKGKTVKFTLTGQGNRKAMHWFPSAGQKTWAALRKGWLVVYALGLESGISPSDVKAFGSVTSLRMILINKHLNLGLPVVPSTKAFDTALLWHTMRQGLSDEVFEWAKKRNPTVGMVLGSLAASAGGVSPSAKKADVYARFAAKLVAARNATDLHDALLVRLVQQESCGGAPDDADGERVVSETGEFVTRVLSAARRATSGRVDESLVLINHVYAKYVDDNPSSAPSLDRFKERLMSAAIDGSLMLASADMPQTLDPDDLLASRIDRGASVYSFLRI